MAKKQKEIGDGKGEEMEKRKFRVVYELHRDGKIYHPGDIEEFALTEAEETKLIGQSLEEVE